MQASQPAVEVAASCFDTWRRDEHVCCLVEEEEGANVVTIHLQNYYILFQMSLLNKTAPMW